ncbi:hypothetical protein [Rhodococcus sp. USK13]|uniref:hypothetical protein n=1 Tax=Rhodococcus sp. USK13 TaxID=2806442 RepID=UPI00201608EE|nr:hypothetical protein [Rhodococcus sp. USK13]
MVVFVVAIVSRNQASRFVLPARIALNPRLNPTHATPTTAPTPIIAETPIRPPSIDEPITPMVIIDGSSSPCRFPAT